MTRRESIELGQRKRERHVGEERLGRRGGRLRGEGRLGVKEVGLKVVKFCVTGSLCNEKRSCE